jgi:hypothetical protein
MAGTVSRLWALLSMMLKLWVKLQAKCGGKILGKIMYIYEGGFVDW